MRRCSPRIPLLIVSILFLFAATPIRAQSLFDVQRYTASLRLRPGPGTSAFGLEDECQYLSTPQQLDALEGVQTWGCAAGTFCLSPTHQATCPPGFYCPPNTAQPQYCCAGWYCPTPDVIKRCEEGYYCPTGSVKMLACNLLADCPAGTRSVARYGIIIFFAILILAVFVLFAFKQRSDKVYYSKYKQTLLQGFCRSLWDMDETREELLDIGIVDVPFHIRFENLGLILPSGIRVLNGVSGELRPSRTCAIIGPSGCGKTTLLNTLAGKVERTDGEVFVNGAQMELVKYRKLTGFVPQDDVMLHELTVRDVIEHSALMRLPRNMPPDSKRSVIMDTINFLHLTDVVDSRIGDTVHRGISGGQRKRVNIALELTIRPSILLLDEPTTGLDSASALELCQMLHTAARLQGLTIAAVIHAPSQETFAQFDDVIVLGKGGSAVYVGPIESMVPYFERLGFRPPADDENPADYCLAVVKGRILSRLGLADHDLPICWARRLRGDVPVPEGGDLSAMRELEQMLLIMASSNNSSGSQIDTAPSASLSLRDTLGSAQARVGRLLFKVRAMIVETFNYISGLLQEMVAWVIHMVCFWRVDPVRTTASEFRQFQLCFRRACLQIFRSRHQFLFDQLLHLGGGLAVSVIARSFDYLGRQPADVCSITPVMLQGACVEPIDYIGQMGVFISLAVCFAGVSVGATSFGHERVVYWREAAAGMDSFPYYAARFVADLIRCIIAGLFFSLSFIVFYPQRSSYFYIFLIVTLLYVVTFAMGYFISMFVNADSVSFVGTAFALAWGVVLSGVVPDLAEVSLSPSYENARWLWSISAPRWAIEALYINEIEARPFFEIRQEKLAHSYRSENLVSAIMNIVYIALCWNLIAFLAMKLTYRGKQM